MPIHLHFLIAVSVWTWLRHLGGVGLVLLGLADNSVVPLPGSMDVLTILSGRPAPQLVVVLRVHGDGGRRHRRLHHLRSGAERRQRGLRAQAVEENEPRKCLSDLSAGDSSAVAVPALLPPPFPIVPFLLAAGAMQYSRKKFVAALALGRGSSLHYRGRPGSDLWQAHRQVLLADITSRHCSSLIGLAVIGGIISLVQYYRYKKPDRHGVELLRWRHPRMRALAEEVTSRVSERLHVQSNGAAQLDPSASEGTQDDADRSGGSMAQLWHDSPAASVRIVTAVRKPCP